MFLMENLPIQYLIWLYSNIKRICVIFIKSQKSQSFNKKLNNIKIERILSKISKKNQILIHEPFAVMIV